MAINAGSVYSELILDIGKYQANLKKADKNMKDFTSRLDKAGKNMDKAGKNLTTKVTLPIMGMAAAAVKVGADFEGSMSEVQAISGATGSQLEQMSKKAREMGKATKYSASESAQAMKYMAMAGWDTTQIIGGLDGAMHLAAASGEDLSTVSDIVTDSMTAFGMKAEESARFADVLAAASSNSNTNVGIMGETFKYVAPLAGSLGYSIEDTALGIGLMANAGIKGSQAGTAMRSMLTRLIKPTKESGTAMDKLGISMTDSKGKMKPLNKVIQDLREKFKDLTPEQKAFYGAQIAGQEAMSGFLAVVNASEDDFSKLENSIDNSTGAAKDMSDIMQDNLKGRLKKIISQLQEVGIQLSEIFIPMVEKAMKKISEWVEKFSNLDEGTQETIVKMGLLAAVIGPMLIVGGKLAKVVSFGVKGFKLFSGAMAVANGTAVASTPIMAGVAKGIALLSGPVGWAVAGVTALTVAGIALHKHMKKDAIPTVELFGEGVSKSTKKAVGGYLELEEKATLSLKQLYWSGDKVTKEMADKITSNINGMKDMVVAKLEEQKTKSQETFNEMFQNSITLTEEEKARILEMTQQRYDEQITKTEEGNARINEIIKNAADENGKIGLAEQLEIERIRKEMKETAIQTLTESEKEQKLILNRLKDESSKISALQASEVVKNSLKQKDESIANAEKEYNDRLKYAMDLRAQGTKESEELADKVEKDAKRQYEQAVKSAKNMHDEVVDEAKKQAEEHVDYVDWETGEVRSKWDKLLIDMYKKYKDLKNKTYDTLHKIDGWFVEKQASIGKSVKKTWDHFTSKVSEDMEKSKKNVRDAIQKIKDFFDFEIKFPKISKPKLPKLPKPKISGSWSWSPPRAPKISWNAEGAIFTKPFIFGNQGVGEAGPEAVLPIEKLSGIMTDTLKTILPKNNIESNRTIVINNYTTLDGRVIAKETKKYTLEDIENMIIEGGRA